MMHLLLEARRGNSQDEEKDTIDTGFATVKEVNVQKGIFQKSILFFSFKANFKFI